ncbi:MAG: DUF1501 domain-containing protein [Planctomycetia bacterium]|nr:DUF1501 domain-containing protein [Planctomycetia bacterium]
MLKNLLPHVHPSRRRALQTLIASFSGMGLCGWMPVLAGATPPGAKRRHCILLWMNGGPSQTDTFDLKPGHPNGGQFQPIATAASGLRISEHLPRLATKAKHLAVLRGLSTNEGDHGRGTFTMRTGRRPDPLVRFPTLGSLVSNALVEQETALPGFIAVNPYFGFDATSFDAGYLGPQFAPLIVKPQASRNGTPFADFGVDNLQPTAPVAAARSTQRLELLKAFQAPVTAQPARGPLLAHRTMLERALQLVSSDAGKAFDLSQETPTVRDKYGRGTFGQGCLLARRLVEQGVSFVEVSLGDGGRWDTHSNNFATVRELSAELDAGWSSLMEDLESRGLLESTTIVWMGEFGRTPQINGSAGRDHFPAAWSAVLAGGGIRGGQSYGRTSADGMSVEDGRIDVGDLLATLCAAIGIDHTHLNVSEIGRPFRIADGKPVRAVLS